MGASLNRQTAEQPLKCVAKQATLLVDTKWRKTRCTCHLQMNKKLQLAQWRSNNSHVAMAACECTRMKLNQAQNVPSTETSLLEHKTAKPEKWPSQNTSSSTNIFIQGDTKYISQLQGLQDSKYGQDNSCYYTRTHTLCTQDIWHYK